MRRFVHRLAAFVRSRQADAELEREIDSHLHLLADRFIAEGMTAREARLAARRAFGGQVEQTKLRQRDARSFRWLDDSWLDMKLGVRMLVKHPGLTLVGGVGLAVAMAISAVSFAFLYSYAFSTLPLDEGERVVALENWDVERNNEFRQALHDYLLWKDELTSFEDLGAFRTIVRNLIVPGGVVEPATIAEVTASTFRIARTSPLMGRPLLADDERPGAPGVLVIGHDVWLSRFRGDSSVIGRTVRLGNTPHTIVGVMPAGFRFPVSHSYWVPLRTDASRVERGQGPSVFIFGRLAPGVTFEAANTELTAIGQRSAVEFPQTHARLQPRVLPYAHPILDIQGMSLMEIGAMQMSMSWLLFVVALNVGILVYARTASRQGEIAVRTALGASRPRIIGQLFVEALVLAVLAAGLGLLMARFGLRLAHEIMAAEGAQLPYWIDLSIPWLAVLYVFVLSVVAALIAGVLPAIQATSRRVQSTLRELSGSSGMRLGTTWMLLIVAQVACAVSALPIAVAAAWNEVGAMDTTPNFASEQLLAASLALDSEPPPGVDHETYRREQSLRFAALQSRLVAALETEWWVDDLTVAMRPPGQDIPARVELEDASSTSGTGHEVEVNRVDIDFFETFGARHLAGRPFAAADKTVAPATGRTQPIIVNRAFVERVLEQRNPLGQRVRYRAQEGDASAVPASTWHEIVGVVDDLHTNVLDPKRVAPVVYHPYAPADAAYASVVIRVADGEPSSHIAQLRKVAADIDPSLRIGSYPLAEIDRQADVALRLVGTAVALIIASVLLLSAAGIYALMSFAVSQRRKEIGIRTALGADTRQLLWSVCSRSTRQLACGVIAGVAIAATADRLSGGELLGGAGTVLLPGMSGLMVVVGLLAALGPVRRGLRIQPTQALREQ